ncbi:hypothetical protein NDU88_008260 [Pleurodeles waltl]|uniref:Uncharacterized protein n=1 Tax=Pleurodeles waltl TaxID=8319 RepID=A0AAV7NYN8_PLEWA|nr:hypothetical protein NDU88_008260 [Pleurodeles waltl]
MSACAVTLQNQCAATMIPHQQHVGGSDNERKRTNYTLPLRHRKRTFKFAQTTARKRIVMLPFLYGAGVSKQGTL